MKLHFKFAFAALSLSLAVNSQTITPQNSVVNKRGCATAVPSAEWDAWFNKKVQEYKENKSNAKAQNVSFSIPVIVHVIHGGNNVNVFPNLSANQIRSQIDVLNKDFAGAGYNSNKLATTGFSVVGAANTHITFCLAQFAPDGTPLTEPGIDRVNYVTNGWTNPATPTSVTAFRTLMDGTIKPATIWDPTLYYNIWISDVNANAELLGYATFPGGSSLPGLTSNTGGAGNDGIWVWARSFGNVGTASTLQSPYNQGRTATHETGHWLGLRHIGGDGNNNSAGDCSATDYCDDTPAQKGGYASGSYGQNFGGPTYPLHANVCSSSIGDMFMNFMDYTDDAYNYMFTPDQNARMQTALVECYFRNQLSASSFTLCAGLPLADFVQDSIACLNSGITPYNATSEASPAPTYSWSASPSAGVTFSPASSNANPTINFPSLGYYTVTMVASNSVGVTSNTILLRVDECTGLKESSLSSKNISLVPNPTNGQFNIITTFTSSKDVQLSIYNALGQIVVSKSYSSVSNASLPVDLSAYPNGIYTVNISNGQERIVKRLVLSK